MSLLKKFQNLNNFVQKNSYYYLFFNNEHVGYVHHKVAEDIIYDIYNIKLIDRCLYIQAKSFKEGNAIFKDIGNLLVFKKRLSHLTGELFSCRKTIESNEVFRLDRALVEMLGVRGYGVHMIVYTKIKNSYKLWIPKRNKNKSVAPSKLDNSVAGGVKAGEGIFQSLKREALEEASIYPDKLKNTKLVGAINYSWKKSLYSIRRDTLYLFDLKVDSNFFPKCNDGEVENFKLMDWTRVLKLIQNTDSFKNNCALVIANFLIRHGLLTNKNEKRYEEILRF